MKICKTPGCGKKHNARGYCKSCYNEAVRNWDIIIKRELCEAPGPCWDKVYADHMCANHWLEANGYPTKRCARCRANKPMTEFHFSKITLDKRSEICRECDSWVKAFKMYKVTEADYNRMLAENDGCAICHRWPEPDERRFPIDHDHSCCNDEGRPTCGNCVRAVLCHQCNALVGRIENGLDVKEWQLELEQPARDYINKHLRLTDEQEAQAAEFYGW